MDRRERAGNLNETLLAAFDGQQAKMWTALPAIIQSFNPVAMTVTAQPTIQMSVLDQAGNSKTMNLPLLVDVPIQFPSGGGFTLTFPVAVGDEALITFSARCIDTWWQLGGIQVQAEKRMHDLSDGFANVGIRSQPRVISGISTTSTQLRSDDGVNYVDVKEGHITLTSTATVTINAPATTVTGTLTVDGLLTYQNGLAGTGGGPGTTITGNIVQTGGVLSSNGTILHTHTHSGVTTGAGNTGAPN